MRSQILRVRPTASAQDDSGLRAVDRQGTTLRAGVGRIDITPPVGIAHGGWGAQVHQRAEGVDMPLLCTALVVSGDTGSDHLPLVGGFKLE